eukprot:TRINITY_DN31276_c0_g1_i1.p2 TRINITY_DN31276_c0_g1~~TRINITY_DN31276_c0_g1_i1.p2  ORF type:complete len:264 (+),score=161.29 TRINITY_DN31276_c0_g1_i1:135-926(+)
MFEARLAQANVMKKIMDAIKELVSEGNFDVDSTSLSLQAMDSNHVALISLKMGKEGFAHFRADKNISLGMNMSSMSKVLKCASNDDSLTLKADDNGDSVTFMFESPTSDRISDFELKLMDIDSEHLSIPETDYSCSVEMSASEFQRICRELAMLGDTVQITANKEGVKFSVTGDMGTGNITCRPDAAKEDEDGKSNSVNITLEEPVSLTFALRYLNLFAKATPLASRVVLRLQEDVPLVVEYAMEGESALKFFLAPKIDDDEE